MVKGVCRLACVLLVVSTGSGCSSLGKLLGGETAQQREARRIASLEVPPPLTAATTSDLMSIPGGQGGVASYSATQSSARGDADQVYAGNTFVSIIKSGEKQWLLVDATPDRTWDLLQQYLLKNEIPILNQEKALGLIETDWVDNVLATPKRFLGVMLGSQIKDRFRIRIDVAEEGQKTEVFFTHYSVQKVLVEEAKTGNILVEREIVGRGDRQLVGDWKVRPSDPEAEIEMQRRFIAFVDIGQTDTSALEASAVVVPEKAVLVEDGETASVELQIQDRFFNAWRLTGLAIDRANFTITDRDRAMGMYYVRFNPAVDHPDEKGFWASLAFWREDDQLKAGVFQFLVGSEMVKVNRCL
jgi:outer membrane protein assembly factor BamC